VHAYREENYLKAIYQLCQAGEKAFVSEVAYTLGIKPPSVLEKVKVLVKKGLVTYYKTTGALLTSEGEKRAIEIIRRHRIWETYLFKELKFNWTEVHELAEQLEHISSQKLIDRVFEKCGRPAYDPHGDPIPDVFGNLPLSSRRPLLNSVKGCKCIVLGVSKHTKGFLSFISSLPLSLNDKVTVEEVIPFDNTIVIKGKNSKKLHISEKVSQHILVACTKSSCRCKVSMLDN